jgi:RNA-binding protein
MSEDSERDGAAAIDGDAGEPTAKKGATIIACSPGMTGKQRQYLRGLGHALRPVVMVGQHGVGDGLRAQLDAQLEIHELVKVRVQEGCPLPITDVARWVHAQCSAAVPQILGRTLLAYRAHPKEPRIHLPSGRGA